MAATTPRRRRRRLDLSATAAIPPLVLLAIIAVVAAAGEAAVLVADRDPHRWVLMIEPSDAVNASAAGAHLVAVTRGALRLLCSDTPVRIDLIDVGRSGRLFLWFMARGKDMPCARSEVRASQRDLPLWVR